MLKIMSVFATIESYLLSHPRLSLVHQLYQRAGITIGESRTIFIPDISEDELKKELKKLNNIADPGDFTAFATKLWARLCRDDLHNQKYASGGEISNKARQICKMSPVSNGKFKLLSGPDLKTEATCEFAKDFIQAKDHKGIADKPICVVMYKGDIAADGKEAPMIQHGAAEEYFEPSTAFVGGSEQTKKIKTENFESLLAKGRNAFTETMAGLLIYLTKSNVEELASCKQVVATLASYDTYGMYLALVQPYSESSFLPNRLFLEGEDSWAFGVAHSVEYTKIFEDFVSAFSPEIDQSARKEALEKIRHQQSNNQIGQQFKELYKNYTEKVFGVKYELSPEQKLWADELLFKTAYCDEPSEMIAQSYTGQDYVGESTYASFAYNKAFSIIGLFNADSLNAKNGAVSFLRSEYFLKCCLVDEPNTLREEMVKYSNPLSAKARAFCLINGL